MKTRMLAAAILAGSMFVGCDKKDNTVDTTLPIPKANATTTSATDSMKQDLNKGMDTMKQDAGKATDAMKDDAQKLKDKMNGATPPKLPTVPQ